MIVISSFVTNTYESKTVPLNVITSEDLIFCIFNIQGLGVYDAGINHKNSVSKHKKHIQGIS